MTQIFIHLPLATIEDWGFFFSCRASQDGNIMSLSVLSECQLVEIVYSCGRTLVGKRTFITEFVKIYFTFYLREGRQHRV